MIPAPATRLPPAAIPAATAAPRRDVPAGTPFRSGEEAWFWTMAALAARREGASFSGRSGRQPRPCEPDDVVRCLDRLYRQRRIDLVHARILRIWGERGMAPDPAWASERGDWRLWREAIERLEWLLRMKGIVG
jgi:hypothetical protein